MNGWVKLHRSFIDWEWHDHLPTAWLFLHLIIMANVEDKKWHGHDVRRGSLVTSLPSLSKATGLSVQQVRTAIDKLKSTGEITCSARPSFRIITITNYAKYQDINTDSNRQSTDDQQTVNRPSTDDQQTVNRPSTATKEYKNIRTKESKEHKNTRNNIYYPGDAALNEAFSEFAEMRRKIRAPLTDRAVELQMKKLKALASDSSGAMDNDLAIRILEQSVMNNWKGLFPLDEEKGRNSRRSDEVDLVAAWREVL